MDIVLKTIKFGDFTLSSGIRTNVYADFKEIISRPKDLKKIVSSMEYYVPSIDVVCGVPMGAIPLATTFSLEYNIPQILMREYKKDHGTEKLIEGKWKKGDRVLLIDDVWTTGKSMMSVREKLIEVGLKVDHMFVIVCRETRDENLPADLCYQFHLRDITSHPMINMKIHLHNKGKVCFAADCGDFEDLTIHLKELRDEFSILKIHPDIFSDYDESWLKLVKDTNIKIWIDLKLCDVPHIMIRQMKKYRWADIISVMSIVGVDALRQLDNVASEEDISLFVVDSLYTTNKKIWSDPDPKFVSEKWKQVIGVVNRKYPNFLYIRAGVEDDDPECDLVVRGRSLMIF